MFKTRLMIRGGYFTQNIGLDNIKHKQPVSWKGRGFRTLFTWGTYGGTFYEVLAGSFQQEVQAAHVKAQKFC